MLFNSIKFLIFFPCVWLLYYMLPFRFRKYLLLAASYYFYMCWKPEFIVLILASTAMNYLFALSFGCESARKRKSLFVLSIVFNLGMLFVFKYANFAGETVTAVCKAFSIPFTAPVLNIVLPVGISFYTFQTMSYTIDVYRGKMEAERDFVMFALFVSFFPQLVAGPIEKASNLLPQLKQEHPFSYENTTYGLKLMAWGFFKKCVIADQLTLLIVDPVYAAPLLYRGGALIIATVAFSIQIYCDFSGYSDIARGCAKTMGIDLMSNFKAPYLSCSITEFWRRWHVSLTDWFREYVYIPLGGNRKGLLKKCLFCGVTFLLSGLWHGANWTFVIWGLLHAVFLNVESIAGRAGKREREREWFSCAWRKGIWILPRAAKGMDLLSLCVFLGLFPGGKRGGRIMDPPQLFLWNLRSGCLSAPGAGGGLSGRLDDGGFDPVDPSFGFL